MISADNQQERLINAGWITGFVDGEGCFSVGFIKQPDRIGRKGYKTGYQVWYEFAVTQGAKSLPSLEELKKFFKIGNLYINKRYDNHKEHLYRYTVRRKEDLINVIIPFFRQYPLHTSKQTDFEKFARCMEMIAKGEHLTKEGVVNIALICQTMNRQKSRESLIGILRDYTSDTQ